VIWQFDPTRRIALWILSLSAIFGLGIEVMEYWSASRVVGSSGVVSVGMDTELQARADSLWRARKAKLNEPIDLNTADALDLERLPGIGPVTAAHMIEYREAHGGFKSVEELDSVAGIGPKKLEALRARVKIAGE
jgi:competence ComEA-like helix-hairpin-helix protein